MSTPYTEEDSIVMIDSYLVGLTIATSSYGDVRLGWDLSGGKAVVVKQISERRISKLKGGIAALESECALAGLDVLTSHGNLLPFLGVLKDEEKRDTYYILPRCIGTLQEVLPILSPSLALRFVLDIAHGVKHLHTHRWAHKDIKPQNCLFLPDGTLVLGDYGCCEKAAAHGGKCTRVTGTPGYQPPQIADGETSCDAFAWDTWSLGVMLYVSILKGAHPFQGPGVFEVFQRIAEANPNYEAISEHHPGVVEILKRVLVRSEVERMALPDFCEAIGKLLQTSLYAMDLETEKAQRRAAVSSLMARTHSQNCDFFTECFRKNVLLNSLRQEEFTNLIRLANEMTNSSVGVPLRHSVRYYLGRLWFW